MSRRFTRLVSSFCPTLLFVLAATPAAAVPILYIDGSSVPNRELVTVQTAGRAHASDFAKVNELIAAGNGTELVNLANGVLSENPESGLAYEVLGVGHLLNVDVAAAIKAFERAAELDSKHGPVFDKLGVVLMESDRLEQAETALQTALSLNPQDAMAHRNLGLLYAYLKRPNEAIEHLILGLKDTPSGYLLETVTLANLLNDSGAPARAIAVLAPRARLELDDENAQATLATSFLQMELWQEALDRFDRALALNPRSQINQLGRAVALRGVGKQPESIQVLQELQKSREVKQPATVELVLSLISAKRDQEASAQFTQAVEGGSSADALDELIARQLLRDKRFDEAKAKYQALMDKGAGSAQVYVSLSELLFADEATRTQSLAVLEAGRKRFPDNGYLSYRVGTYHASLGDYEQAVTELNKARRQSPENWEALRALSLVHARMGDNTRALQEAEDLLQMLPDDADTQIFTASAYERSDKRAEAIALYEKVLVVLPGNIIVLNNMANLLAGNGDLARAETMSARAAAGAPQSGQILDTHGYIQLQGGKADAAVTTLQAAIAAEPELAIAHYHLGLALVKANKKAEAKVALEKALSLRADASWAGDARQQLTAL